MTKIPFPSMRPTSAGNGGNVERDCPSGFHRGFCIDEETGPVFHFVIFTLFAALQADQYFWLPTVFQVRILT